MSRSNRDIGGYRGRRTVTDILRIIAVMLAVLVVLAVAGVIYLQRYVVYTDEGPKLELPPFLQALRGEKEPSGSASLPDPGDLSIDIQPVGDQSEPQEPDEPEPPGFAVQLSLDEVLDGSAAAKLEEAGAAALILEVKDQEGKLAWLSAAPEAARSKVNGTQEAADALRRWNAGEVYTIARVCCFRDDSAGYYCNTLAFHQSNGTWRDELGLRWLSPAEGQARGYIAALCGELAELGFDEIVLEQFSFPVRGKLERIIRGRIYDASRFTADMEALLIQVQQAVEPYGTKISLRIEEDGLTSEGLEVSGLTPQMLEQYAYRIWTTQEGLSALSAPPYQGYEGGRTAEIVAEAAQDSERFQAVLPE